MPLDKKAPLENIFTNQYSRSLFRLAIFIENQINEEKKKKKMTEDSLLRAEKTLQSILTQAWNGAEKLYYEAKDGFILQDKKLSEMSHLKNKE